ncbi:nucleoside monophosphate kinase [Gemmata sp. JC717]|uniref:Adenylate kinase n=1 Tax=Gemmata algarum TaxID=2975278 RepID=A0ABU5EZA7_9BACT|nr:nucleoside monophosphate kinase [Gemmata algarum]MDY3551000.1 nucleoside monophosphate kinase [Gemmata algarum]MDY3560258.1 nucleoside monophosphate kinase [Gemmata algarum]
MRLVLVGPPGSGKGTQADRLVRRFGLTVIGTGAMFRDAIKRNTETGRIVGPLIKQGLLAPDTIVNEVVAELFRGKSRPERFVMDGYPRTYSQAVAFDALLRQEFLRIDAVVNLRIDDDEVVRRISGRRCCSNAACGVCFHVTAQPPKVPGVCTACGAKLVLRDDDKEETVRRRLGEFHKNTDLLLEHYRRQGLVDDIDASQAPEKIFADILAGLLTRRPDETGNAVLTAEGRAP